jgi:hypothetical protein
VGSARPSEDENVSLGSGDGGRGEHQATLTNHDGDVGGISHHERGRCDNYRLEEHFGVKGEGGGRWLDSSVVLLSSCKMCKMEALFITYEYCVEVLFILTNRIVAW